ncbi:hypothetical protein BAE44_0010727 [Dichanthelium oligosanthes]|uniref:Uncharacterized protein n=1 Tax=Dichanthelium oligosanthes TaxID=888268 RepID=A0A1E5VT04_9POAL|nr:hypothetical protein BAE44_0010727 [Dichanthelium oligosanthes]
MAKLIHAQAAIPRQPKDDAQASLLGDQEANIPNDREADNAVGSFSWLTLLGFLFLSFNSAMAIVRSKQDRMAMAFIGFSYADLVALFICLRMYERAPVGSSRRDWLKIAVWTLTTLLTFAFSSKVAAIMPPMVAVLVWLMAFATVAGGFIAFFIYKEKK